MPSGVKDIQLLELKDTISQLNKTISTQNELISSLQKMLEERNAKDSEKDLLIANLQSQLAYLKNKVFGSTSEIRHDQLDGQLNLFGTPVGDEKPAEVIEPEVISVKGYTKERKPKATYDDKYNSVRSICKHFFTDIVGLSIKFFCVSLRHMSIGRGVILAVAFQKVDAAPHTKAAAQGDDQGLQYVDGTVEELHKSCFLSFCRIVVGFVCQFFCAQFVHIERLVRLHDGRSALHVPFYVKDVLLIGVGQVFVAGVLCQVVLVAEKRAHAPKLQDTLAAVHDRDLVLGHQLLSQFLITEAVRGLRAAIFGLAQAVDGLLAQQFRDLLER